MDVPTLPIDVLRALMPALPVIREQVREGVISVERPRIERKGRAAARAAGDSGYLRGYENIISGVFHSAPDPDADDDDTDDSCGDCGYDECRCDWHCAGCEAEQCEGDNCDCSCGNCGYEDDD